MQAIAHDYNSCAVVGSLGHNLTLAEDCQTFIVPGVPATISKYGYSWPVQPDDSPADTEVKIEMACIQNNIGKGLPFHYEQMRRALWPYLDDHRWHRLCRDTVLANKVTVLMGPGSCGKTHEAAWLYLCEYLCFPETTCVLVSSTDIRGLKLRVWGEITMLWEKAKERFEWLPGNLLDSRIAITTDSLEDGDWEQRSVRDMRKAICGIPCVVGNKFVGLSKYQGIKQKRMRLIADEAAAMAPSFLSAFANLNQNEDFRAIILGNPNDPLDALGRAAEPLDGWTSHMEPEKTEVWKTRFMGGTCVNLIGTDSPNFDFPENQPTRYRYLIGREKIAEVLRSFGKDSFEYYSQCVGSMRVGTLSRRVITRDMCQKYHALEQDVNWAGAGLTRIYAVDAAYGGDRCVGGYGEFGLDTSGQMILRVYPPKIIPIAPKAELEPEEQIAIFVKNDCKLSVIPPENMFHDSTGRGALGTMLAREWSPMTNPVEFGGMATPRPVSMDMYIYDPKDGRRRLKRCDEHYSKFVTELWFSVRYTIEAGQLRGLTEEVMEEGCMREWNNVKNDKKELETKKDMKERVGRSPDLFDWLSIIVEGARRRGFQIKKMANEASQSAEEKWRRDLQEKQRQFLKAGQLQEAN